MTSSRSMNFQPSVSGQNRADGGFAGAHETGQDQPGKVPHLLLRLLAHAICGL